MAPIEWLDHTADAGFRVCGDSMADVFEQAARGLFSVMVDVEHVRETTSYRTDLIAPSLEELLVAWLSDLLAQKDLTGLVFSRFRAAVTRETAGASRMVGEAWGEPLDRRRHRAKGEVKGISYLGLRVEPQGEGWIAQVVVDV